MRVEIWSDVVCPWCAIGRGRLRAAVAMFDARDSVEVRWRSFELDPTAPPVVSGDYIDRLAAKYSTPRAHAQAMVDRMTAQGAAEGVTFRFDLARPGNTFDAHRVLHLAWDRGTQGPVKARLLSACLAEGEPIGDRAALCRLAGEAGPGPGRGGGLLGGGGAAAAGRSATHVQTEQRNQDETDVPHGRLLPHRQVGVARDNPVTDSRHFGAPLRTRPERPG